MKKTVLFVSLLYILSSSQGSYTQIIGFYPPADTIGIGFGCTPPIIICSVFSNSYKDSITIDSGWNTAMGIQDEFGYWQHFYNCYFIVLDSLNCYEYELWIHPQLPSGSRISVPFDSSFYEFESYIFKIQLIVREQGIPIDSISQLFLALVGLRVEQNESTLLLSQQIRLFQNYPNPFNPVTNIQFFLPKASDVRIEVFDVGGKKMATIINSKRPAGFHTIQFDGSKLASGIYFYRLQAGKLVDAKKMILMK